MRNMTFVTVCFIGLIVTASALTLGSPQTWSATESGEEVLSFDMWCLEMQFYPPKRCNSQLVDDVKTYEQYRKTAEQYNSERAEKEKHDQELKDRVNRNPTDAQRDIVGKVPE